jgi:adenosine deaminase
VPDRQLEVQGVQPIAEHPLPRLVRAGVRCTISTDSRTVADPTLTREYELMAGIGMTDEELQTCNQTAYAAAFGRGRAKTSRPGYRCRVAVHLVEGRPR